MVLVEHCLVSLFTVPLHGWHGCHLTNIQLFSNDSVRFEPWPFSFLFFYCFFSDPLRTTPRTVNNKKIIYSCSSSDNSNNNQMTDKLQQHLYIVNSYCNVYFSSFDINEIKAITQYR